MKKTKTFGSILMACAFSIMFMGVAFLTTACGEDPNTITISSYDELVALSKLSVSDEALAIGTKGYSKLYEEITAGKTIKLTADIDCQGEVLPLFVGGIQDDVVLNGIGGEINGNGHTIKNFKLTEDNIKGVATSTGSSSAGIYTLSLFPLLEGCYIHDLTFKDVTISANVTGVSAIQVALFGYVRSAGNTENATLSNVTVDGLNVNVSFATKGDGYGLVIGGLIGLDADVSQAPVKDSPTERTGITVKNMTVVADAAQGGNLACGGVVGMCNYESVLYKNCSTSGTMLLKNAGTDETGFNKNSTGSFATCGGIVGWIRKDQTYIAIQDCTTDFDFTAQSQYAYFGKFSGLAFDFADGYGFTYTGTNTSTSTAQHYNTYEITEGQTATTYTVQQLVNHPYKGNTVVTE